MQRIKVLNHMRTAICYVSKHGATERVARRLGELLVEADTQFFNLKDSPRPDLDGFDRVIVGAPIYAGVVLPEAQTFCREYEAQLLTKPLGLYLCAMNAEQFDKEFDQAFPEALRRHARSTRIVGGAFDFKRMNFVERFIVRRVVGVKSSVERIYWDRVEALAREMA